MIYYKGYILYYGYQGTDRWYIIKDSYDNFIGAGSGYSTEKEAMEYIDSIN